MLGGLGVGDKAVAEHLAGAGHVRQPLGDHAAGAALRRGGVQAVLPQSAYHRVFQRGHVHIVGGCAENLFKLRNAGIAGGLGGLLGGLAGRHADLALAGLAVDGGGGVRGLKQRRDLAGNGALAAQHPQRAAVDRAVLPFQQNRADLLGPHGLHLPRDAGHQRGAVAVGVLKPRAGGRAVVVDELVAHRRAHGLLAVVRRGASVCPGEKVDDLLPLALVKGQRIAERLGHGLLRQIVLGGAETARKDEQVAAAFRLQNQLLQAGGVITDDMLVHHADTELGQLAA